MSGCLLSVEPAQGSHSSDARIPEFQIEEGVIQAIQEDKCLLNGSSRWLAKFAVVWWTIGLIVILRVFSHTDASSGQHVGFISRPGIEHRHIPEMRQNLQHLEAFRQPGARDTPEMRQNLQYRESYKNPTWARPNRQTWQQYPYESHAWENARDNRKGIKEKKKSHAKNNILKYDRSKAQVDFLTPQMRQKVKSENMKAFQAKSQKALEEKARKRQRQAAERRAKLRDNFERLEAITQKMQMEKALKTQRQAEEKVARLRAHAKIQEEKALKRQRQAAEKVALLRAQAAHTSVEKAGTVAIESSATKSFSLPEDVQSSEQGTIWDNLTSHLRQLMPNALRAAFLGGIADLAVQLAIHMPGSIHIAYWPAYWPRVLDFRRTGSLALFSLLYTGFFQVGIYGLLDQIVGHGRSMKVVAAKLAFDCFLHAPAIYIPSFYLSTGLVQGRGWVGAMDTLKLKYLQTVRCYWMIWLWPMFLLFLVVPVRQRVVVVASFAFVEKCIYSIIGQ